MEHFEDIYAHKAEEYHRMILAEDVDGNILTALNAVCPMLGKKVIDFGSGTGRIPLLTQGLPEIIIGLDLNFPMLQEQKKQRDEHKGKWPLVQGDMRKTPFPSAWADIVIAGWAIGHLRSWFSSEWQKQIGYAIEEMYRIVKDGGSVLILETLGTGSTNPAPPVVELEEYYSWLEKDHHFTRHIIQTDYLFSSISGAVESTEFFFGKSLANKIQRFGWKRVPEWTGLWVKTKGQHSYNTDLGFDM